MLLFDLALNQIFQTNSVGAQFDEIVLTDDAFELLGPGVVDIIVHGEGLNVTTYFNYEVKLQYRGETGAWTDVTTPLLGPVTGSGTYTIGAAFSDRTKLGRRIRLVLRCYVTNGQTGTHRGYLTLLAAVRLYNGC